MGSTVNLPAIYIANLMGVMLLLLLLSGNTWKLMGRKSALEQGTKDLLGLIIVCLVECIADPIAFTADGRPGALAYACVYGGNLCLFLGNLIIGPLFIHLIADHVHLTLSRLHRRAMQIVCGLGAAVLAANFFVPLVFVVDANNVYSRRSLFWVYLALEGFFVLDSLWLYARAKRKGGILKFFPVWQFIIPVTLGAWIQAAVYSVSVIWPCIAVSICGIAISLQNEMMFRDKLTGLYNRLYLDHLVTMSGRQKDHLTVVMLDLNGFKFINDRFGHSVGDEALIAVADILVSAVGTLGAALRYAGDEFVVVLNTQDDWTVTECIQKLRQQMDEYNRTAGKDYQLSASVGSCPLDLREQTIDELMSEVDRRMYADKKRYYESHAEQDRRRR